MPQSPLILVTNDDGISSPGLHAAAEAVAGLGELLLVAPATQQTAMSRSYAHGGDAGVIKQLEVTAGHRIVPAYAVSGSPATAVAHAVLELADRPIALCVSGINYGENIGGSIAVSGTVGAAMEAASHGIPAIAASVTVEVSQWRTFDQVDWAGARHFTRLLAEQVLAEGLPDGVSALNLNVPQNADAGTELRKTVQSDQRYYIRRRADPARPFDQPYQFLVDVEVDWDRLSPQTDIYAVVRDHVASVTPLTWRMTADTDWAPAG